MISESVNQRITDFQAALKLNGSRRPIGDLYAGVDLGTSYIVTAVVDGQGAPIAGVVTRSLSSIRDGLILDYVGAIAILRQQVETLRGAGFPIKAAAAAYPPGTVGRNAQAFGNVLQAVELKVEGLIDEPTAASLVLGITEGAVVDIGGGTTEVAIMSLADIAASESIRIGGDDMDDAIINHLKKTYNLLIGEARAEKVKMKIGSAVPLQEELVMEIAGRDTISGMPRKIVITSEEVREALKVPIAMIIDAVAATLEKAEPELSADLIDNGIHICGGGSMLRGMDSALANATGLRTERVEDPLSSVARGTSVYMENLELWKDTMNHNEHGWE